MRDEQGSVGDLVTTAPIDRLAKLGLRSAINAAGTATRFGGGRLHEDVIEAMSEAARSNVAIDELEDAAGQLIATATSAEAGYVTSGASAGLALAVAACMARLDPSRMGLLPNTVGMAHEVVVQRAHRNSYDRLIRTVGATIVDVGYLGHPGTGRTHAWELEAAIGPDTAAVVHLADREEDALPLADVVRIAHSYEIPVVVDAAAALPPAGNLRAFVAAGADAVVFSGGKAIGGPQATGLLCGRAWLVQSAALQHQDMDVHPLTWSGRSLIESGALPGPPQHGIGRGYKVGKESIVGLMVARKRFTDRDEPSEVDRQVGMLQVIAGRLSDLEDVLEIELLETARGTKPTLVLALRGRDRIDRAASAVIGLRSGAPPIYVSDSNLESGEIRIMSSCLAEDELEVVARRLRDVLIA